MIKPLFQNVLVAVNGSESSIHAAMYGIMMAKLYHSHLKFVYVVDTATIKSLTMCKFFVQEEGAYYEAGLNSEGQNYLNYVMDLAKSKGITAEAELRQGAIWSEIIMAADEFKSDLILLGGVDSQSFDRDSVFSSADKDISCHAKCSVMVVHQTNIEQLFKLA